CIGQTFNILHNTLSERQPIAEVRHDGEKGDFFPGFSCCVEVQHERVELVGDVADAKIDAVVARPFFFGTAV
ncbi:MAG: hypothetical protein IK009_03260, partial [Bacteroidales bacterium]|nr:hypothetical protein [Bacteroidales bacterium]